MKNFVVYTAITKGYDPLRPVPSQWRGQADFIAFLEEAQPASGWEVRPIFQKFSDPCRNAKVHKILPHRYFPEAQYSLWIDGSMEVKSNLPLPQWVEAYLGEHDLAVFKHRYRNCLYQEGRTCARQSLDSLETIDRQMRKYFQEGYPLNNGFAVCSVLFRRHTQLVEQFNEIWHREIMEGSRRDQLSFNYAAYKAGLKYAHLPGLMLDNPHFNWLKHVGPRSVPTRD